MKEVFVLIFVALLCHVNSIPINGNNGIKYRLESDFKVDNYDLLIKLLKIEEDEKFEGTVEITLIAIEDTKIIQLHVGQKMVINPEKVTVTLEDGARLIGIETTNYNPDEADIVAIKLMDEIRATETILLKIEYTAEFSNDMYGLYLSTFKEKDGKKTIAATQFHPTNARRVFPCLDEPQYKATFKITIQHPKEYHAISNQPEEKSANMGDDIETTFEKTTRMSTYLVAFVVSNFKETEVKDTDEKCGDDNTKSCVSNIWTREDLAVNTNHAVEESPKILKELNEFTNINYWDMGMNKLDQVAIPDLSGGAMENWGLITYRETSLLFDPKKSTARNKQRVTSVIAHEFAHMWFGNLITIDRWDYTWLNEGFARFFEYFITGLVHKEDDDDWKMDQQFVVEQIHSAFIRDGFETTKKLNHPVNAETEIKAKFDKISYNKGASVIRMLEHAVGGRKIFKEKIQNYLQLGKETVKPEDLYAVFDDDGKTKWGDFMKTWVNQEGYPLITVSRKEEESKDGEKNNKQTIVIKQERFFYEQPKTTNEKKTWHIPLTYATKQQQITKPESKMITKSTDELPITKGDFLIFNVDQTGYYRVKYEGELLDELLKTLKEKPSSIPIINRAQIVDDYMNFARAGKIDYVKAFEVISFLENEEEYLPWYAALNSFSFLRRRFSDENIRNAIDEQMENLMGNVIRSVDFATENVKHFEMLKKILILEWAFEINKRAYVNVAKVLFTAYKTEQKTPGTIKARNDEKDSVINANLRGFILCAGLRHSENEKEDWDFLKELLKTKTFPQEQATIITSLGCTKIKKHLKMYLEMTLDDTSFKKQDKMAVFNAVLTGNPIGVDVAFEFLKNNLTYIQNNFQGLNVLSEMITNVADRLTSENQMNDFQRFLEKNKDALKVDIDQVTEILKTNQEWIKKNDKLLQEYYIKPDDDHHDDEDDDGGGASGLTMSTFLLLVTTSIIKNL